MEQALARKQDQPMDVETAAIFFGLGRAQAVALEMHHRDAALANLTRAFDYYAGVGDVSQAVAVAERRLILGFGGEGGAQLLERDGPGYSQKALERLQAALKLCRALVMRPLTEQVQIRLRSSRS